jgi:hypothetical protein
MSKKQSTLTPRNLALVEKDSVVPIQVIFAAIVGYNFPRKRQCKKWLSAFFSTRVLLSKYPLISPVYNNHIIMQVILVPCVPAEPPPFNIPLSTVINFAGVIV